MANNHQSSLFKKNLGYNKYLYILPFDHRSYFETLLNFSEPLTSEQVSEISEYKKIIYQGYEKSLVQGIPQDSSAILVDDTFGFEILQDAAQKNYITLQSTEVSGQDHFSFDHKNDWQSWIKKINPTFVKALVRFNPESDQELLDQSIIGLKELSDFAHTNGYKFLIEPLLPATEKQLSQVTNDKYRYDTELRPKLTVQMISIMQEAGIEPDVWKIEGMFSIDDYEAVVHQARIHGRDQVGIIALGRNETDEVVETWLRLGAQVPGVIGFAVGRTIFLDALLKYKNHEFSRDQAVAEIAARFLHFYKTFTQK